jgi:DNA-binding MarR family transcriptional regulator
MDEERERSRAESSELRAIEDASRSLFRLGRAFGRLPRRDLLRTPTARDVELSAIHVVQAVEAGEESGREVTIGVVAAQLGIDPSTASRLVTLAVEAGYLRRRAALRDRRAIALELTEQGRDLAEGAARFQRSVFDAATTGWPDEERQAFARLFVRFADAIVPALNDNREVRQ